MPRKISAKRRAALINDLINADFDLTALHSKYALSPDSLSQWIQDENNHRCLAGLCVLADLQTQLLLSRYRLIAAGRLIDLATTQPQDSKTGLDNARRACVDLLKLEMKRADIDTDFTTPAISPVPDHGEDSLRRLLYQDSPDQNPSTPNATANPSKASDD
jgi:hypothetical protein